MEIIQNIDTNGKRHNLTHYLEKILKLNFLKLIEVFIIIAQYLVMNSEFTMKVKDQWMQFLRNRNTPTKWRVLWYFLKNKYWTWVWKWVELWTHVYCLKLLNREVQMNCSISVDIQRHNVTLMKLQLQSKIQSSFPNFPTWFIFRNDFFFLNIHIWGLLHSIIMVGMVKRHCFLQTIFSFSLVQTGFCILLLPDAPTLDQYVHFVDQFQADGGKEEYVAQA